MNETLVDVMMLEDLANSLTLRSDIHRAFDRNTFVFLPKQEKWVAHFMTATHNLGPRYHNVAVDVPSSVSQAFLLARVAEAAFGQIRNFLTKGEKRYVKLRDKDTTLATTQELAGDKIRNLLGLPERPRSASPRKRKQTGEAQDAQNFAANEEDRGRKKCCLEKSISTPDLSTGESTSEQCDREEDQAHGLGKDETSDIHDLHEAWLRQQRC